MLKKHAFVWPDASLQTFDACWHLQILANPLLLSVMLLILALAQCYNKSKPIAFFSRPLASSLREKTNMVGQDSEALETLLWE